MPKRLLIVEDDPGYRALLALRLQKAGFDVATAEGGDAAKALFLESPVPLVVSDLVMPKGSGLALLGFLKSEAPETEAILLSGRGTIEQAVEAMRSGAFDFLVKPVADGKLEALVADCFERLEERKSGKARQEIGSEREMLAQEQGRVKWDLTRSEAKVVALVLKGKCDQEIAEVLFISYHTVKKHLQNVFRKMRLKNRIELILKLK